MVKVPVHGFAIFFLSLTVSLMTGFNCFFLDHKVMLVFGLMGVLRIQNVLMEVSIRSCIMSKQAAL